MRATITATMILISLLLSACRPPSIDEIQQELIRLSSGLIYISETDSELTVVRSREKVEPLTERNFLLSLGLDPATEIETLDLHQVFANPINHYRDGARWRALQNYLDANLKDVKVFKIGSIRRDVFAVGLKDGYAIGVHFVSVET